MELVDFLLARIAEDEADARRELSDGYGDRTDCGWTSVRVLAECEAKRRIVKREARRRRVKDVVIASSHSSSHAWVSVTTADGGTERLHAGEFEQRFTEPADSDILRDLALPYADHPDYNEEWKL
jgi:hypothetical protein